MADRNLGRIAAVITLRDLNFTSTLTKARTSVSSFGTSFGASAAKVITGGAAIAAASAAAYAAIAGVGAALDRMGKSADDAAKLGMQDMPEFLAGLQYRAKLVGVEAGNVSDSLGKLFRTIAEARAGSKADQDILSTLGLSVASLSGQSPDKVVLRVADALDHVADSGERARLAVALFGRSGANMVNVLRGGSGGIGASVAEAQRLGVARSAGDLAVADAAGDAIDRARVSIEGFWNELTVRIAPAIEAIANFMSNLISGLRSNTVVLAGVGDLLVGVGVIASTVVDGLRRAYSLFDAAFVPGHIARAATDLYSMRFDNAYEDGASMFAEVGRRFAARISENVDTALSPHMPGLELLAEFEKSKARMEDVRDSATEAASVVRMTFADYVGPGLRAATAKVNEYLKAQQSVAKAARDKYWYDKESARLANIAKNEATAMSIAEGLTAELMAEQEEQSQKAEERARRISELVSSPMGGAPLIMSGSSEAQLAQFNNTNARVQAIGERQLTVQERIDRELKRIGQREANIERLFEQVLQRIPTVMPI